MGKLNVLYQFDNNYAPYAGISMLSLFEKNKELEGLQVYCAAMDVSDDNIQKMKDMASDYDRTITFLDVTKSVEQIKKLNVGSWNGSLATWIKIFIIEDLIDEIDQLLYLDCDTLVNDELSLLVNFDFENNAMACVVDALGFRHVQRLGIEAGKYYYNAGIMFYNLKYFRERPSFYDEMLKHLAKNVERYPINDQDLLNDFFCGKIKKLSPKYNFQCMHYMYSDKCFFGIYGKQDYYTIEEVREAREDVKIIHFLRAIGDYPWAKNNLHPVKEQYEYWKAKSLWKDLASVPENKKFIFKIEKVLYKMLPEGIFLRLLKYAKSKTW